jgi:hypothetical protein
MEHTTLGWGRIVMIEVHDDLPAASPTNSKRMRLTNPLLMWPL